MPESASLVHFVRAFFDIFPIRRTLSGLFNFLVFSLSLRFLRQIAVGQGQENALCNVTVKRAYANRGFERPQIGRASCRERVSSPV